MDIEVQNNIVNALNKSLVNRCVIVSCSPTGAVRSLKDKFIRIDDVSHETDANATAIATTSGNTILQSARDAMKSGRPSFRMRIDSDKYIVFDTTTFFDNYQPQRANHKSSKAIKFREKKSAKRCCATDKAKMYLASYQEIVDAWYINGHLHLKIGNRTTGEVLYEDILYETLKRRAKKCDPSAAINPTSASPIIDSNWLPLAQSFPFQNDKLFSDWKSQCVEGNKIYQCRIAGRENGGKKGVETDMYVYQAKGRKYFYARTMNALMGDFAFWKDGCNNRRYSVLSRKHRTEPIMAGGSLANKVSDAALAAIDFISNRVGDAHRVFIEFPIDAGGGRLQYIDYYIEGLCAFEFGSDNSNADYSDSRFHGSKKALKADAKKKEFINGRGVELHTIMLEYDKKSDLLSLKTQNELYDILLNAVQKSPDGSLISSGLV